MKPYSESDELIPPFGLGYLATAVRKNHDVKILDGIKEKLTLEKFENLLKEEKLDIIGIQIFTFQIIKAKDYIETIKKVLPRAKIILGLNSDFVFMSIYKCFIPVFSSSLVSSPPEEATMTLCPLFFKAPARVKTYFAIPPTLRWVVTKSMFI